ncbi:MAG: hypothetical protein H0T96_05230 [Thermoleophilaceae bacterium]|jgi:hypothetical protein|nr:hypothetical protein [Thermoleophilaceae bacterium]MBA3839902.1 hypothetical protein [Thermoleophilaceae bacterium]MDQ3241309.1 hypothetical protein [Actinomycetota bacterium]MDQ3319735.1 hypothetical protein [Actinomycetota bacterium]
MPANRDVVAVRSRLEEELGETVSRRLAARLLGVSHTALARWVRSGDLPVVYNAAAREEIPLATLLDLHEAVEHERRSGDRRRHVLEPTMVAARARAGALRARDLLPGDSVDATGHDRAELRSLAYHRALARQLSRPMINDAMHTLWTWREQGKIDSRYADRWEEVLRQPVGDVRRVIGDDSGAGRDLRQNSPFAGMLSEAERRKILAVIG